VRNFILVFTLIFSFSCSSDEFEKDGYDKDGNSYNGPIETIIHNGVERKYIIYTPQAYDGTLKLPLLLNFHGFGGQAGDYMSYTNMRSTANSHVFPAIFNMHFPQDAWV
jgi:polyhydroxybutyrate depolymerase